MFLRRIPWHSMGGVVVAVLASSSIASAAPPQRVERAGVLRSVRSAAWRLPAGADLARRAVAFLGSRARGWGLPDGFEWQAMGAPQVRGHRAIVQVRAVFDGLPVVPGIVRVVVDDDSVVRAVTGLPPPPALEEGQSSRANRTHPDVLASEAAERAVALWRGSHRAAGPAAQVVGTPALVWYGRGARLRLAWQIRVRVLAGRLVAPEVFVDARNGAVLWIHDTLVH